jgi:serine protease Do
VTTVAPRVAFVAIAGVVAASAVADVDIDRRVFIGASQSLVRVEAAGAGHRTNIGTGVIVGPGKVVTNCHVTHDADTILVHRGGVQLDVARESDDVVHDLCLLSVPGLPLPAVRLGRSGDLSTGEPVVAIGYNGGYEIQYSDGVVKALYPLDGSRVIRSSTAFTSGASGGGLFDATGRLVGILTFRLRGGASHYFAMPVDWLAGRIDDARRYVTVAPMPAGKRAFWQGAPAALPLFMQAASLEAGERWQDLLAVSRRWLAQDGGSANAWYAQGRASIGLDRSRPAIDALERAVAIDPRMADAWFRLGVAYLGANAADGARKAHRRLLGLDRSLADELAHHAKLARIAL